MTRWRNTIGHTPGETRARFVFVGAGGWALKLLQSSRIPEIDGYGVFPIGGQWLKTSNSALVDQHRPRLLGHAEDVEQALGRRVDAPLGEVLRHLVLGPENHFADSDVASVPASIQARYSSTLSTARNASCGISTEPTDFIRFLPSFCFSRSFRLRVMSPP